MTRPFREIVAYSVHRWDCVEDHDCPGMERDLERSEPLAHEIIEQLRLDGYAIHTEEMCVRPGDGRDLGRAMTEGEAAEALCGAPNPEQSGEFCALAAGHRHVDEHAYAVLMFGAEPAEEAVA